MKTSLWVVVGMCLVSVIAGVDNRLKDYVYAPDSAYAWNVSQSILTGPGYKVYNVYLTSQHWLTPDDSTQPIWRHWLQVCVPDNINQESSPAYGLLYIDGGSNKTFDQPPDSVTTQIAIFCMLETLSNNPSIVATLLQIPDEPMVFYKDPERKRRSEDGIIAYTWAHYLNYSTQVDWLLRFPMTKASVQALDAIQEFSKSMSLPVPDKFVVAGASKRGWTTWMVGCMEDPRVVGIAPLVAPVANITPQFNEQYESYGEFSFAINDYIEQRVLPGWLNTPEVADLLAIIDPLNYTDAMKKIPKYVIAASQDEFFMTDAAQYYWDQLPGEKNLWVVPNADHSLALQIFNVVFSVFGFVETIKQETDQSNARPVYHWEISNEGKTVKFQDDSPSGVNKILEAKVYFSKNNPKRDWRLATCSDVDKCFNPNAFYGHEILQPKFDGDQAYYEYTMEDPDNGTYTAFYIELKYQVSTHLLNFDQAYDAISPFLIDSEQFNDRFFMESKYEEEKIEFLKKSEMIRQQTEEVGADGIVYMSVSSDVSVIPLKKPYPHCPNSVCACKW
eukprot:CAMPEP_0174260104 /NCGR_PEP_ID=MMETSP0439-20130205/8841_1 /TAXON_ID=0 /ORGANISM="Stereomyxa ramosa, Strain Chinc5" /LENGTH=558 /DNA_ID=CAMNT_0015344265 /DNA_START=89 /DNA_END=1762 /DNA_ORIENTATION=+